MPITWWIGYSLSLAAIAFGFGSFGYFLGRKHERNSRRDISK